MKARGRGRCLERLRLWYLGRGMRGGMWCGCGGRGCFRRGFGPNRRGEGEEEAEAEAATRPSTAVLREAISVENVASPVRKVPERSWRPSLTESAMNGISEGRRGPRATLPERTMGLIHSQERTE